jgi:hypothetical protein
MWSTPTPGAERGGSRGWCRTGEARNGDAGCGDDLNRRWGCGGVRRSGLLAESRGRSGSARGVAFGSQERVEARLVMGDHEELVGESRLR